MARLIWYGRTRAPGHRKGRRSAIIYALLELASHHIRYTGNARQAGRVWSIIRKVFPLLLVFSSLGFSQFSFGVKAGIPLNDAYYDYKSLVRYGTATNPTTQRFLIGPTLEVHLPGRFSIEADAIYRRSSFDYSLANANASIHDVARNLEFPLLAKWEITPGPIRPFVDGGVSFRHIFLDRDPGFLTNPTTTGGVLGAGITLKAGRVRISPEIRYTRWGSTALDLPSFRSVRNQGDFMVGFTF
jgi:hypothetical protein